MPNLINGGRGGDALTLFFADGHIENIPMSKVHIEANGITDFPANGYPIIAGSKFLWLTGGLRWKYTDIRFGTSSINNRVASINNERNDSQEQTYGRVVKGYLPMCVNSIEDLKNGKFIYSGDVARTSGNEIWYVWAEK